MPGGHSDLPEFRFALRLIFVNGVSRSRSHESTDPQIPSFGCGFRSIRLAWCHIRAEDIEPTVTWGISPDHGIAIGENIPDPAKAATPLEKASIEEALAYMKLGAGTPIQGVKIDVAFIGSCTNGRISDFREVARYIRGHKVAAGVQAIVVPGSQIVAIQCEQEGLPEIFREAGFEWRGAGCSMCLAMNPDKLVGDQLCASSSNRNFKGRQGSPTGRTVLMSPVMVAAAAIKGHITDARELFQL